LGANNVIVGIAGVFIMISFFVLMVGVQLFMVSSFYLPQIIFGLISAFIGFYLLGMGLDTRNPR
jgi:hypothetical protein